MPKFLNTTIEVGERYRLYERIRGRSGKILRRLVDLETDLDILLDFLRETKGAEMAGVDQTPKYFILDIENQIIVADSLNKHGNQKV